MNTNKIGEIEARIFELELRLQNACDDTEDRTTDIATLTAALLEADQEYAAAQRQAFN